MLELRMKKEDIQKTYFKVEGKKIIIDEEIKPNKDSSGKKPLVVNL